MCPIVLIGRFDSFCSRNVSSSRDRRASGQIQRPAVIRRFVVIASGRGGLFAMIAAFVMFVSVQTIRQHRALETRAFDLGVFESVLWNTVHGRFFWSPLLLERHLGQHSSFILLTLVPDLRRGAETGDAACRAGGPPGRGCVAALPDRRALASEQAAGTARRGSLSPPSGDQGRWRPRSHAQEDRLHDRSVSGLGAAA